MQSSQTSLSCVLWRICGAKRHTSLPNTYSRSSDDEREANWCTQGKRRLRAWMGSCFRARWNTGTASLSANACRCDSYTNSHQFALFSSIHSGRAFTFNNTTVGLVHVTSKTASVNRLEWLCDWLLVFPIAWAFLCVAISDHHENPLYCSVTISSQIVWPSMFVKSQTTSKNRRCPRLADYQAD